MRQNGDNSNGVSIIKPSVAEPFGSKIITVSRREPCRAETARLAPINVSCSPPSNCL